MLSFEFSAFDLVLSVAMIVLIVLFISTLLKLNPSTEQKRSSNEEDLQEEESELARYPTPEPEQPNLPQMAQQTHPASWQNNERTRLQKPKPASGMIVNATVDDSFEETMQRAPFPTSELREPSEKTDSKAVPTPPLNSSDEKVCPHTFGYLKRLPKNTAIPEECFGCQKIVDCLIKKKSK